MTKRIKPIPKHIPRFLNEVSYRSPSIPPRIRIYSSNRGKSFSKVCIASKSNISHLLNDSSVLPSIRNEDRTHPEFEYELCVRNSIQFANKEYKKLANIIGRYKSANDRATNSVKGKSMILPSLKSEHISPIQAGVLDYNELKDIKKVLYDKNRSLLIKKSSNKFIDIIVKNNEIELKKIFSKERKHESSSSSLEGLCESEEEAPKKELMRKKWEESKNKNLFRFVIDTVNDSVSLKRIKKDSESIVRTERAYRHFISKSNNVLPAHLQKCKLPPKYRHNDSIMIFYKENEKIKETKERAEKKRLLNFKSTALELGSFCSKARDTDITKKTIIHNILQKKILTTSFDLDRINISVLPLKDLFTLYFKLKAAINPTLYNVDPPALQQLDPEVVNNSNFTLSEGALVRKYESYIKDPKIFRGFWVNRPVGFNKPICREGMGVATIEYNTYIFGGYGSEKLNDLWVLETTPQYKWTRIKLNGDKIPENRFGHCMIGYGKSIYIHGGGNDFNVSAQMRKSLNDTWKYSISDNCWTQMKRQKSKLILPRVNGASTVLEGIWLIHGGCAGSRQNIYQDIIGFDLTTEKFVEMSYTNSKRIVPGLIGHSMVSVLPAYILEGDNKGYWYNFHAWKFRPENSLTSSKIGAYILGGIDSEGDFSQDIWMIKCNSVKTLGTIKRREGKVKFKYIIDCEKVITSGIAPKPRMNQTAIYFENYIAVFGGKNDKKAFEGDTYCLNDLCLLNLQRNEWIPVLIYGFAPIARWSAAMFLTPSQKLIIFGGVTDTRYCSFNGYELETENLNVEMHLTKCKQILSIIEEEAQYRKVFSIK